MTLPEVGAEGSLPSTPPAADVFTTPTTGFGAALPKATAPEHDVGAMLAPTSPRVATVFLNSAQVRAMDQSPNSWVWPWRSCAKESALAEPLAAAGMPGRLQILIHQLRPFFFAVRLRAHCALAPIVALDVPFEAFVCGLLADLLTILRQNSGEVQLLRPVDSRRRVAATLRVDSSTPLLLPYFPQCCRRCRCGVAHRQIVAKAARIASAA